MCYEHSITLAIPSNTHELCMLNQKIHGNIMPLVVTLAGTHTIATATDFIKRRRAGMKLLSHAKATVAGSLVYLPWQMQSCSLTCLRVVSFGS